MDSSPQDLKMFNNHKTHYTIVQYLNYLSYFVSVLNVVQTQKLEHRSRTQI